MDSRSGSGTDVPRAEDPRTGLMRTSREWARALSTRDVDQIVSYWSEDAVVLPPDRPAVVGLSAIRQYVAGSLATPGFSVTWEPEFAFVDETGTVGYLLERSRFTFPDPSGAVRSQDGKTVTVWRKAPDGHWKCVVDIWNGSPPGPVLPPR